MDGDMRGKNPNSLKNLLPRPPEGAQRKGGIESKRRRREKKQICEIVQHILDLPITDGKKERIKNVMEAKTKNLSVIETMVVAQIKKAVSGDTKAFNALLEASNHVMKVIPQSSHVSVDDKLHDQLQKHLLNQASEINAPDNVVYEEDNGDEDADE